MSTVSETLLKVPKDWPVAKMHNLGSYASALRGINLVTPDNTEQALLGFGMTSVAIKVIHKNGQSSALKISRISEDDWVDEWGERDFDAPHSPPRFVMAGMEQISWYLQPVLRCPVTIAQAFAVKRWVENDGYQFSDFWKEGRKVHGVNQIGASMGRKRKLYLLDYEAVTEG